jgi:hypothetical protein
MDTIYWKVFCYEEVFSHVCLITSSEVYDVLLLLLLLLLLYVSGFIMCQILVLLAKVGRWLPKHVEAG